MNNIVIINYGIGNLTSVKNMLQKAGNSDAIISNDIEEIKQANKLVLPGVGHFDYGMDMLMKSGLVGILEKKVIKDKTPILGICLGAQLMTEKSEEGTTNGLGWIAGETVSFNKTILEKNLKIPHMGWNTVIEKKQDCLPNQLEKESRFYFVHSYHMKMKNASDVWLTTNYGYEFCAAFHKDNIYGCQFHPEKSHKYGLKLMENFIAL